MNASNKSANPGGSTHLLRHQRILAALDDGGGGDHLGSGCSDAYGAGLNGTNPASVRAPGSIHSPEIPVRYCSEHHTGHKHDATAHRIWSKRRPDPSSKSGRNLFCRSAIRRSARVHLVPDHPGQCNMYNNVSYHQHSVIGRPTFLL